MMINKSYTNGDGYKVTVELQFECKRCGARYHFKFESIQPSKEHIDSLIDIYVTKFNRNPYSFAHICASIPEQNTRNSKIKDLPNFEENLYINYGIPELLGFDVSINPEKVIGEG